ncbi:putative pyruvate kinase [Babesia bovis T2Bo]|uniref:Pyruvate kinase n=1 Tax=Babesia bovis TaxID=5865 RepID=A7ANX7_BABBO|nr:putative pyruvate kinase [Babesia bovis T2Bo]EDO08261.1 putative pyruvate kinase [Babesia bovis T2Bo]|eukprot:XP_001611829.1 pyruvate kinase [Babesia bovis T2Bo]
MATMKDILGVEAAQLCDISLDTIRRPIQKNDLQNKHTHIVCTMGPALVSSDAIVELIDAGMNICRFNFSHGDHVSQKQMLDKVREAMAKRPNANIGLLLDTKGPEIRTGLLKDHKAITLVHGQSLKITTDYTIEGDNECISCSYPMLTTSVKVGGIILIADGSLSCEVTEVHDKHIVVKVLNNATIGERKNMNLPGVKVELPVLGEKDINDIVNFAVPHNFDFIALSFAQSADDIKLCRKVLGEAGKHIKIIPKIENVEGLIHFDAILDEADGVMVARGDLGMEIPLEKVCMAQKYMIKKCNEKSKPVITATQMLESMINNPRPTRAESCDVANAVMDGTDCVMLSGESANGKYPALCVQHMAKLCFEAESCSAYRKLFGKAIAETKTKVSDEEALARSAALLSMELHAAAIVCVSDDDKIIRHISKCRPVCPVFSYSPEPHVVKYMSVCRGVRAKCAPKLSNQEADVAAAVASAKEAGTVNAGDSVVVVYAVGGTISTGNNSIRVVKA